MSIEDAIGDYIDSNDPRPTSRVTRVVWSELFRKWKVTTKWEDGVSVKFFDNRLKAEEWSLSNGGELI